MSFLAEIMSTLFDRRLGQRIEIGGDDRSIEDICQALANSAAESSAAVLGGSILGKYEELDDTGKLAFFRFIAHEMTIDADRVREALALLEKGATRETYGAFMEAVEPPRQELIRRINRVPNATGKLVRMRQDLLRLGSGEPDLQALDLDFRHLFASWFNRGFLVLRRISWESPAHILEKIIAYEAVHAIDSWDELRRRLEPPDRRCFAFFHPAMPDEPLIFVEVALTSGVPGNIRTLLADDRERLRPEDADTAAFYSISNCQAGLSGISFGNSLIKQVAADLSMELPALKTFVTLSPIPGLCKWLEQMGAALGPDDDLILRAAARYILTAKRTDGLPLDPVARFHLGNGAEVHAVHAGADLSPRGQEQSAGAMVNYLYDLPKASQNQERFAAAGRIAASAQVKSLAAAAFELQT
ncbi:malonyl-CoA decarboxylase [Oricola sp.]|uniref:malonyl-CoA decarboxylase n=1 Tax=Oricola sp. TaxID=1979950 RepID=UPI0025D9E855|nr:malonyl-CoA decarboxylase [Oricola sp.]MCI5074872.1 malonyl-CoA decarboxylase [Oricola sp.]